MGAPSSRCFSKCLFGGKFGSDTPAKSGRTAAARFIRAISCAQPCPRSEPCRRQIRLRRPRKVRQTAAAPIYQGVSLRMQALATLRNPVGNKSGSDVPAKSGRTAARRQKPPPLLFYQSGTCARSLVDARKPCHRSETPPSANLPPPPPRGPTYPPPQAPRGRPVKPLRHFSGKYRSFVRFPTRQTLKRGPLSIIIGIVSTFKGFCEKPGARVFRQALGDGYFLG